MAEKYDRKQLRKAVTEQGWSLVETSVGFRAVPPDPTQGPVQWHNTPSDRRADMNTMAEMKRRGFVWPFDKKAWRAKQRKEQRRGDDQ